MQKHDKTLYGEALAHKVADFLERGGLIAYDHRDYCGMGLIYDIDKKKFAYCNVNDGAGFYVEQGFDTAKSFVQWLSKQSDESLSGENETEFLRDNQRITRERLTNLPAIDMKLRTEFVGIVWDWKQN